jgi:non-canonical purine NTP pyrophosphatase (RdgB/HAM1 family)
MAGEALLFATKNADKVSECRRLLAMPIEAVPLELVEIQSTSLEQVVRVKAQYAFNKLQKPVFVEDTSLRFLAWGALPGPFIKHFVEHLGLTGMLDALSPAKHWGAEAACGIGYHDGKRVHYFEGRQLGMVVYPIGSGGFGWDPIFRPSGSGRTYAEMSHEEKAERSMRSIALRKFADFLLHAQPAPVRASLGK